MSAGTRYNPQEKKKVFTGLLEMDSSVSARKFPANSLIIKILRRGGGCGEGEGNRGWEGNMPAFDLLQHQTGLEVGSLPRSNIPRTYLTRKLCLSGRVRGGIPIGVRGARTVIDSHTPVHSIRSEAASGARRVTQKTERQWK